MLTVNTQLDHLDAGPSADHVGEFERLFRESRDDEEWSRFVYQVRLSIESVHSNNDARIRAYHEWLERLDALNPANGAWQPQLALAAASFHNRIGDALMATNRPVEAADAYHLAYDLRHARWKKDPDITRTQIDLLSSVGHCFRAEIAADRETEALAAARTYIETASHTAPSVLEGDNQGLWHAGHFADLAESARAKWPARSKEIDTLATEAAAQLLDRLPDQGQSAEAIAARARLVRPTPVRAE